MLSVMKTFFRTIIVCILVIIIISISLTSLLAWKGYYIKFSKKYKRSPLSNSNKCNVCHIRSSGGGKRNAYGRDWKKKGKAFYKVSQLDSDGDGYSNRFEIKKGTFPGNAKSFPKNTIPVAHAGDDTTVIQGSHLFLNGSKSYDEDTRHLKYNWSQVSGDKVYLPFTDHSTIIIQADTPGIFVFSLHVFDGIDKSKPDTVQITVLKKK